MTAATHEAGATRDQVKFSALLGVLGVVYGDIGTSPLYAVKASLEHFKEGGLARGDVLGVLSLIFWSLILIVTVKYILLVMRADNEGEGGVMALITLVQRIGGRRLARSRPSSCRTSQSPRLAL